MDKDDLRLGLFALLLFFLFVGEPDIWDGIRHHVIGAMEEDCAKFLEVEE